jgi:hypothetical protein
MNYRVDLDPTHSVIRLTVLEKVVTLECAEDIYTRLTRLSWSGDPYAAIYDLSAAKRTTIPTDTVRELARRTPSVPMGRPHVVVGREPVIFGLARLFQMCREFRQTEEFEVVHTLEEAYELVKASPEDFTKRIFPAALAA